MNQRRACRNMVLDEYWNGNAFYDIESARFEIYAHHRVGTWRYLFQFWSSLWKILYFVRTISDYFQDILDEAITNSLVT